MSKIRMNSRTGGRKKKSLSSYASFALFVAAAAIALSAFIVRMGSDRLVDTEEREVSITTRRTTAVTEAEQEEETGRTPSTTSRSTSKVRQQPTQPTRQTPRTEDAKAAEEKEDSEETAAIQVLGGNKSYVRPSGGAVIKPCSVKELAYSRTMKDWRVHNGLDIAAEKGEVVKSAGEGKVTDITHDSLYGTTVVVNQNDGLMVYYRGLNKETAVRKGENIAAGATLGTVGEIPCEAADGTHLHIEVRSDSGVLDPAVILGIQ